MGSWALEIAYAVFVLAGCGSVYRGPLGVKVIDAPFSIKPLTSAMNEKLTAAFRVLRELLW